MGPLVGTTDHVLWDPAYRPRGAQRFRASSAGASSAGAPGVVESEGEDEDVLGVIAVFGILEEEV